MESRKNGELIKKKKAKTEKSFKITKVRNPLATLPPFTYFVYLGNQRLKAVSGEFN